MFAILKREVKAYFQTVTGWLFIAAVLVLYGLYFYVYNLRAGYPYTHCRRSHLSCLSRYLC